MTKEQIAENLYMVRGRLAAAARASGRAPCEVTMIGVTKLQSTDAVRWAAEAGLEDFGENYPREFYQKFTDFPGMHWHFIGHLQTNKVKYVAGNAVLIQSVDSLRLAEAISRHCVAQEKLQPVLLQVNIGREPQKGGVLPEALLPLLESVLLLPGLAVRGLMAIPPREENSRPYFSAMRSLWEKAQSVAALPVLSMGMSEDYAAAVEEGATMVRVGRAVFGERRMKEVGTWQETACQDS